MYPYATFTSFILCNRIFKTNLIRNVVHYSANLCNRIFNTNHIRNVIYHIRNVIDSLPQGKLNEKKDFRVTLKDANLTRNIPLYASSRSHDQAVENWSLTWPMVSPSANRLAKGQPRFQPRLDQAVL